MRRTVSSSSVASPLSKGSWRNFFSPGSFPEVLSGLILAKDQFQHVVQQGSRLVSEPFPEEFAALLIGELGKLPFRELQCSSDRLVPVGPVRRRREFFCVSNCMCMVLSSMSCFTTKGSI